MKVNRRKIKLVVGLGNPGKEYAHTYHNVGILAIDFLENNPLIAKWLKSDSYMNQSGSFIRQAMKKYGAKPEETMIIHDDSDIELGKYKFSFGRGSAGHRGAESVIKTIGAKDFWRLRIGIRRGTTRTIRRPTQTVSVSPRSVSVSPRLKAGDLVLKKIVKKDWETLKKVFQTIQNEIKLT